METKNQIRDRWQKCLRFFRRLIESLSPELADETGGLLALKLVGVTFVVVIIAETVVPKMYDRYAAEGIVISGLALVAYGVFGPWDL